MAAVIGRPNVGKSTLINAIVGRKVSIVTAKPQTTRHRILAVHTTAASQVIFVDTPGLHRNAGKAMNRLMNRTAANALADADVVLFVSDATRWTAEDDDVLRRLRKVRSPVVAVLNKIDRVQPKEKLLDTIALMSARYDFAEIIPVSALERDNLEALLAVLPAFLPESPPLFPEDMHTDRSREFHIAETIREKLTLMLHQELPYGLTVQVERLLEEDQGITINAVIWVERDSQKGIVVGKGGAMLKRVGRAARLELREQLACPVHLELWVKVRSNWADREEDLMRLGFEAP
ncbi:MAG: GTPase Era [Gammaproteobacteria bacterium]|nr:GTPase Era [Gammaproteobacteria bacterium]NNF48892.1 GTPase Era [Woeseiaceae bacterium]MBT8095015.1 GTPase Era [Gammaproteobacteria bacterium]MBT8104685.1 GTPase Era [Gammaproteobacteria bacterium]NNK24699.1 GTPase Era [Woeseiaceae bacterium]